LQSFHGFSSFDIASTSAAARQKRLSLERDIFSLSTPVGTTVPSHLTSEALAKAAAGRKERSRSATPARTAKSSVSKKKARVTTPIVATVTTPMVAINKKEAPSSSASKKSKKRKASKDVMETAPPPPAKTLIRPSKLGSLGSPQPLPNAPSGTFSSSPSPAGLFESSPAELIVEGKRQWKPTAKLQESLDMKKSIAQYANAVAKVSPAASGPSASSAASTAGKKNGVLASAQAADTSSQEKIQRILASQWDSRLRKVENKFVKSSSRLSDEGAVTKASSPKPLLLRQPKLELNQSLLQKLRSAPSQRAIFSEAIQQSLQSADKTPPRLLKSDVSINPGEENERRAPLLFAKNPLRIAFQDCLKWLG